METKAGPGVMNEAKHGKHLLRMCSVRGKASVSGSLLTDAFIMDVFIITTYCTPRAFTDSS